MPASLVRVHKEVRQPKTKEYDEAIAEFVKKMGGTRPVIEAILKSQMPKDDILFDNTITKPRIPRDEEDFYRSM